MSPAQYRILGRLMRGETLAADRYVGPSFKSLFQRGLVGIEEAGGVTRRTVRAYSITEYGRTRFLEQKPRPETDETIIRLAPEPPRRSSRARGHSARRHEPRSESAEA